jgi:hypothetical protein
MDSAVLSLTCAGLGAPEEDEDGSAVGYVKGEHCLGTFPHALLRFASVWIRHAAFADLRCCAQARFCR